MAVKEPAEITVEEKLKLLYSLQQIDTEINKIKILRGELPLEVSDLEDEIAGLETRIEKIENDINSKEHDIMVKNNEIKESQALIAKYEEQQNNVRNNREFESLAKEVEFQTLEIELAQKRIKEFTKELENKKVLFENTKKLYGERKEDLDHKKSELDGIIEDTEDDEKALVKKSEEIAGKIEERLLTAYTRIRDNARNHLAVVDVERNACGGCFNNIPPQRQLDVKTHKKIIVCEYCGRILVDGDILSGEESAE